MKRLALVLLALASLAACTSDGAEGNPWYSQGDVTYDSVRAAADACKTKGGEFQLKPAGDPIEHQLPFLGLQA
jgi:hypothetical protein